MILNGLKPERVMKYFEDICAIPHGSSDTDKIADYCMNFAREHGLEALRDTHNNVIIRKQKSPDSTSDKRVIIQGHLDMVCAAVSGCHIDFKTEGLRLKIEDGFICAEGTTLGGDDGIAVAMALAVLEAEELTHPALECIFTTDEEIGMLGASALDMSKVTGDYLLNIDSEDEGVFTVSCAGGAALRVLLDAPAAAKIPSRAEYVTIHIGGLTGGHSGVEIHKGRANACILLGGFLAALAKRISFAIAEINGGEKDNSIPRECRAGILVYDTTPVLQLVSVYEAYLQEKYAETDPYLFINYDDTGKWSGNTADSRVIDILASVPDGVRSMSKDIEGLVETSSNLGIVSTDNGRITLTFSVRSSSAAAKTALINDISRMAEKAGGAAELSGEYPAWEYKPDSELRKTCIEVFTEQYGHEPVIDAIHAGLECGIFSGGKPGLDCISFGPDIHDIHTPNERLDIQSVERVYQFLIELLKRL